MTKHKKHFNARMMVKFKNGNANASDIHTVYTENDYLISTWEDIAKRHKLSEIKEVYINFR